MNRIGDSGIITDKYSLFKGKMCVVVGELDNMYLVKLLDKGQERQVLVSKRGIDFVKEQFAKGGNLTTKEQLIKELQKLQRDLNSQRLRVYTDDGSEEEIARQRERQVKLKRFNEILEELRKSEKMAKGGRTRFRDKVESISNRLEGTKVPPKYRKRYGLTYNKEESQSAARNIAGAMMKKEKYK